MEALTGLLDSPLNVALAVGLVAGLGFLFLPKDKANALAGKVRAWVANLGVTDDQQVKSSPQGVKKSVLVPTRLGRLLGAIDRVNALQSELDALGLSENEYTQGLRDQLADSVERELCQSGKGVPREQ